MNQKTAGLERNELLLYGAVIGLAVTTVLISQSLGLAAAIILTAVPIAVYIFYRWPETGIFLILILVSFGNEYSQTEWGVRSAEDLRTIYNYQIVPGLTASVFDLIFAAVIIAWLGRKFLKKEPFIWPPQRLRLPIFLCLGFVFYGTILGLYHLPDGFELYHILRELRPFLYLLLLFVMAVDILTLRGKMELVWALIILLAFFRGVQGIVRYLLGIGRYYYGAQMVYYDYSDTILLLAGMVFLVTWLLWTRRWRISQLSIFGAAIIPMAFSFVFSFRRSFWVGTAVSLFFLLFYANNRERWRYLSLAVVGGTLLIGLVLVTGQLDLVNQRITSITDTEEDSSNYFRLFDTENALNAVYESGALGMGFGSRYEVVSSIYWLDDFINHVSRASHNGHLYLIMKLGLPGYLSWGLFWLAILSYCFKLVWKNNNRHRHIGLAIIVILVACGIANLFLPLYYNLRPMLLLAIFSSLAVIPHIQLPTQSNANRQSP